MAAGLLLTAVMAVGCAGSEASGREVSDVPGQPAASTIPEEGFLPGDQRVPGPPTVTTAARRWPLGKGSARPVTTTSRAVTTTSRAVTTTSTSPPLTTGSVVGH
jgi:hypothetical protein